MATCPHADSLIPLLHDNELQGPLRREMVTHMSTCVTCARTFSLLEREQELFTQVIEQRIDSLDFSNFWHAVEGKLSEPAPSGVARLRLWYESWRPTWSFPMPVWAAAAFLLLLVPTHLSLNRVSDTLDQQRITKKEPSQVLTTTEPSNSEKMSPAPPSRDTTQSPPPVFTSDSLMPPQLQRFSRAELKSLTVGPGAMTVEIQHDYESNSIFIFYGDGTNEYPQ